MSLRNHLHRIKIDIQKMEDDMSALIPVQLSDLMMSEGYIYKLALNMNGKSRLYPHAMLERTYINPSTNEMAYWVQVIEDNSFTNTFKLDKKQFGKQWRLFK